MTIELLQPFVLKHASAKENPNVALCAPFLQTPDYQTLPVDTTFQSCPSCVFILKDNEMSKKKVRYLVPLWGTVVLCIACLFAGAFMAAALILL